ncbi:MAG: deoxyribodipyrimidine photo-lyase [Halioglobus sp.]|nr:deoxyribodipyrimidine photo-lyase [Halioglobus sp.]
MTQLHSSVPSPVIYWFRQDLRLADLAGLDAALATGRPVLACYILDDASPDDWQLGGASRWWLHHSLAALAADIAKTGGQLHLARGRPEKILLELAAATGADLVCCSRQYEPWARALEEQLHGALMRAGVELKRYRGALLWEPSAINNKSGTPFKVFTPFWRKCRVLSVAETSSYSVAFASWDTYKPASLLIEDLDLLPMRPNWAHGWDKLWQPGERGAKRKFSVFMRGAIAEYDQGRNYPARGATSGLSPHLHFGEIAPHRIFRTVREAELAHPEIQDEAEKFLSEIGWREFSHHLLFHFPTMPTEAFKSDFSSFPWLGDTDALKAWQQGKTGYPIVDAGMRELWHTGYMHNRVRMVAASFLCKHLLVDWRAGQRWFWDTLVDADLANNTCGWQWVVGSGADASPYFRIFNPTTQAQKFDSDGDYIRRWLPELAALPDKFLHQPSMAPVAVLEDGGVVLGATYPHPIVDHRDARDAALAAYAGMKSQ